VRASVHFSVARKAREVRIRRISRRESLETKIMIQERESKVTKRGDMTEAS